MQLNIVDIKEWKMTSQSDDYDYQFIQMLLVSLNTFRTNNDIEKLMQ